MSRPTAEEAVTVEGFARAQAEVLGSEISVWPSRAWYPSSVGHPCDRFLVWSWNRHEEKERHSLELQSIFNQGRDHQAIILRRLDQLGFTIVEQDRPVRYKVKNGAELSGKLDGKVRAYRGERYKPDLVLEVKSMAGHEWERLATVDDLRESDRPWTRAYYAQGQLYCLLENLPRGIFVVESKAIGMLKLIPFELDYAYAESILRRIEALQPMVDQGVDPEPITWSQSVCGGCGFERVCYPPRNFGEGPTVLLDEDLLGDLQELDALRPSHTRYGTLDKKVKARFKREGIASAIAGPFQIEGRQRDVEGYTVPDRVDTVYTIKRMG